MALAACGGGGGSALPRGAAAPASGETGTLSFSFTVPAKTGSARRRVPLYISSQTAAITVTVTPAAGGTPTTSAPIPCTSVCTGSVAVPAGVDKVAFTALSSSGAALSAGSTVAVVIAGQNNTISATLDGIVASVALTATPSSIMPLTPAGGYVIVNAYDAAGSLITYNGAYVDAAGNPVALDVSASDPSVSLGGTSTVTVSAPGAVIPWTSTTGLPTGATLTFSAAVRSGTGFGTVAPASIPVAVGIVKHLAALYPGLTVDATLPETAPGTGASASFLAHTASGVYENISESGLNASASLGTSAPALPAFADPFERGFAVALNTSGTTTVTQLLNNGSVVTLQDATSCGSNTLVQGLGESVGVGMGVVDLCRAGSGQPLLINNALQAVVASAGLTPAERVVASSVCPTLNATFPNCLIELPVAPPSRSNVALTVWRVDSALQPVSGASPGGGATSYTKQSLATRWVADAGGLAFGNASLVWTLAGSNPEMSLGTGATISALCAQPTGGAGPSVLYALVTPSAGASAVVERLVLDPSSAPVSLAGSWTTGGFQTPVLTSIPLTASYAGFLDCNAGHVVLVQTDGSLDELGF